MKKTMFALACAAVCVAGAGTINSVDFEDYTETGPLLSNGYGDDGLSKSDGGTPYFVYTASSGSTDGSTVSAHEKEDALTGWEAKSFGKQYLSLSTEGGTLWRSILEAKKTEAETDADGNVTKQAEWTTGDPQIVPDTGLYIDTMVQFTPTEDGSEPELGEDAKLAIWLNVAQAENGTATTNLCVRGSVLDADLDAEKVTAEQKVFVLSGALVEPGAWYRLTVKAVKNVLNANAEKEFVSAFQIFIDGQLLSVSAGNVATDDFIEYFSEDLAHNLPDCLGENAVLLRGGKLIPALRAYTSVDNSALSAVGFKGSGAIDDFCVTDEAPSFTATEVTTVDFTLTWDGYVSSVTYTIGNGEPTVLKEEAELKAKEKVLKVNPDTKVTVNATAADWYKVWSGIGEFTVKTNVANQIKTQVADMSDLGIGGFPTNTTVIASEVQEWAEDKEISLKELQDSKYAYDSFLLGSDLLTADPVLTIDDVTVADGKMTITVAAKKGAKDGGGLINLHYARGVLYVKTGDTLNSMKSPTFTVFDMEEFDWEAWADDDSKLTVTLKSGKFAQVKIGAMPDEMRPLD